MPLRAFPIPCRALSLFVVLLGGVAACVGEVPVGEGTGKTSAAYGGQGEPPRTDGSCDTGLVVCSNVCTSTDSDSSNCGACGAACASGESCVRATCVVPAGSSSSGAGGSSSGAVSGSGSSSGGVVVSPSSSSSSGGGSGSSSGGPSSSSSSGSAGCGGPNLTQCGSACVDTSSDPANCGACGMVCPAVAICERWTCVSPVGDDGGTDADPDADSGPIVDDALAPCPPNSSLCGATCVDLATDPANCGACGAVCGPTQMCIRAACQ